MLKRSLILVLTLTTVVAAPGVAAPRTPSSSPASTPPA